MANLLKNRSPRGLVVCFSLLVVAVAVLRGCIFRPATNFPGVHFNQGSNAAWLGVEWVNEAHDDSEIAALADELNRRQIRTIFFFVSYLKANGEFNPTFAHAAEFARVLTTTQPDLSVQARLFLP